MANSSATKRVGMRLYTDWRRCSRGRNRRILFLAAMAVLAAAAVFVFGGPR